MNIQKKMIRQRAEEQADRKVGEYYDAGIMLGIKFAALALNRRFGFGKKRLTELQKEIDRLIDEIVQGAPQMTPEYRQNLEHGIQKLDKAASQIMEE